MCDFYAFTTVTTASCHMYFVDYSKPWQVFSIELELQLVGYITASTDFGVLQRTFRLV